MSKRKTTEEFIKYASLKHSHRYNYSLSKYLGNKVSVIIICQKHGEFSQKPNDHLIRGDGCPYCSGHKVSTDNSLAILNPKLSKEWSYEKNRNLTPLDVTCFSNKKVWWQCEKSKDHIWKANISSRSNGFGCPCCSGLKVVESNCLRTINPALAKEWNSKNFPLTPSDVSFSSGKKVWWKCDKGHEWEATINKRSSSGRNCPYCSNQKVCIDTCLATKNPTLALEWNYEKNKLKPEVVFANSSKKVWWKCVKGHEWKSTIANRNNGSRCPNCEDKSIGHKKVLEILNQLKVNFDSEHRINECKNKNSLPFDFAIKNNENKVIGLVEYQGEQHYKVVNCWNGESGLISQQKRDKIKADYCTKNKIPLLAIPYWDFDNVEIIIKDFMKSILS